MMDPDIYFVVGLGVMKELQIMGQICLYIVTIYLIPGKDRSGLWIPFVENRKIRSSKFLGNGAILFQFWC